MFIKIPKLDKVGTFKCPRVGSSCYSNCCGRQAAFSYTEGPEVEDRECNKKRKLNDDEGLAHATGDVSKEGSVEAQETIMEFSKEMQVTELSYEHGINTETVADGDMTEAGIQRFLSRPVLIDRIDWEVGNLTAPAPHTINPWTRLIFSNSRIREKISTFKLFSGTLKVRIVVNGSPFHYGRLFVGMKPGLVGATNNTIDLDPADVVTTRNYFDGATAIDWEVNRTFYSQRPHVLINPNTNSVAEITWPFFTNTPWLDLDANSLATETIRMGQLEIWELNFLQHAGGATDATIAVSFFAWLEDVVLTGATPNATATVRKQKGKSSKTTNVEGKDEYNSDGIVSMPATALADFASNFTDYSFIGPYARATEIGARAVGSIAKIFGWSKPVIVDKECFVTRLQLGRMANTMGQQPLTKLTFDPKQELSVDPGLLDLPRKDEESFSYISQIEGLFYQEVLTNTDMGHIVGWVVSPNLAPYFSHTDAASNVNIYNAQCPCGFITAPFELWRGSLIFRIQFVVSKMHRGRFLLVYTPESNSTLPTDSTLVETNAHFSQIVDLSEDTDVSFEVKWNQNQMYSLINRTLTSTDAWLQSGATSGSLDVDNSFTNGRLDLYVINPLAIASNDDTSIQINLYMRAGDDFTVTRPSERMGRFSYSSNGGLFPLTSTAAVDPATVSATEEDVSTQTISKVMNPVGGSIDARSLYNAYQGEQIHSVRALCKRYQGYFPMLHVVGSGTGGLVILNYRLPLFPNGRAGGAYGTSGLDVLGSISNVWMTYLRWFAQGYVGYRGGMRYAMMSPDVLNHFVFWQFRGSEWDNRILRTETSLTGGTLSFSYVGLMGDTTSMPGAIARVTDQVAISGSQYTNSVDTMAMMSEFPWYSAYRFAYIHNPPTSTGVETQDNCMNATVNLNHRTLTSNNTTFFHYWNCLVAAAEDTQFHFFFGAPPFYEQGPYDITQETA